MGLREFLRMLTSKEKNVDKSSTVVNNNQQLSTVQQFNRRDLEYARRIGQIEEMSANISEIKEKLTGLDIKFDLRIPDKILTEDKFMKEVAANSDVFKELDNIKRSVKELKHIINTNQQLSTIVNSSTLESISKSTEIIEANLNEAKISEILKNRGGSSSENIGKFINLSRTRVNQILLEMEKKGLVSRIKSGRKFIWNLKA